MKNHFIKSYPVDNGDTTLITLSDLTNILIDCKLRNSEENPEGNKIYDVKKDLLKILRNVNGATHLDLFVLTHPDEDHCLGYERNFYKGGPEEFGDSNKKNSEIIIDEMWVTSMVFNGATNDDAKAFKKEAERRRKLWVNDDSNRDKPGNRIRMIGYDGNSKFAKIPASVPGESINIVNGKIQVNFEFFVHSPFKSNLIEATAEKDKNFSSIVMQARFKADASDKNHAALFLFGGDADHNIWNQILEKSKKYENRDKLDWDVFLAPHHVSWTYFNDVPYDDKNKPENKTPKNPSLEILEHRIGEGKIIASSKIIKDNDDNPPHYKAKGEYIKKLKSKGDFLELAKLPNEKAPEPVIFEVSKEGVKIVSADNSEERERIAKATTIATGGLVAKPWVKN